MPIKDFITELKEKAEKRFEEFKIVEIDTISSITEDALLRKTNLGRW